MVVADEVKTAVDDARDRDDCVRAISDKRRMRWRVFREAAIV